MNKDLDKEQENSPIEDSFDVTGLILDFLGNWKWFLLSVVICGVVAYYYVSTIIPIYNVSASIYLSDENASSSSQQMLGISNPMVELQQVIDETEIEILRSKNNLIKIVDSLDLSYSYYHVGKLRDVPEYKSAAVFVKLDSISLRQLSTPIEIYIDKTSDGYKVSTASNYAGGDERQEVNIAKLPAKIEMSQGTLTLTQSPFTSKMYGTEKVVINNPNVVAAQLSANLQVDFAKKSQSILRLSLNTTLIEQGRDILRVLVDFYNQQIIEDKNRSAIQTEVFILDRLAMINGELRDVEDRLRNYREVNNIVDLGAQTSINLAQRSSSEAQIAEVDAQRQLLGELEGMVNRQDTYSQLPAITDNEVLSQSIDSYNKAVSNYERALESMGAEHPQIEKMQTNLNRQKSQIVSNIEAAKRENSSKRRTIVSLDSRSAGQLAAQPTVDKGLNEIFREQQVKVNIYTFLLQKREEIALQKTLATPTAQFIDNPSGGSLVLPDRNIYLVIGLLVGLLIPAIIITLRRLLVPKFADKEELERVTSVPVIGEICLNTSDDSVVVGEGVSTSIAELFRLLRNNVNFLQTSTGEKKVILVTSSVSGEGKTFISLNLAMTYALTGKKVILIGLDIRRPVLAHLCGMTNANGLTNYLSGMETDEDKLIQQSSFNSNLYIMPAGPVPPNPNELLMSDRLTQLFEILRNKYDYVIIDTAPVGLVSDTLLIANNSDIQLYVTRANYSTRKGLKVLHEAINSKRLKHAYLVLNGVNVGSTAYIYRRYGHYGHYNHKSYGYTYGYGEDGKKHGHSHKKKRTFFFFRKNKK